MKKYVTKLAALFTIVLMMVNMFSEGLSIVYAAESDDASTAQTETEDEAAADSEQIEPITAADEESNPVPDEFPENPDIALSANTDENVGEVIGDDNSEQDSSAEGDGIEDTASKFKKLLGAFMLMLGNNDDDSDKYALLKSVTAKLVSGASLNADGDYVWTAKDSSKGHSFAFRINYALSGTYEFEPGSIEIRIPKSILIDRDGNPADYYELSVPQDETQNLPDSVYFTYHEDGDSIVISNRIEVPAGWAGYFEVGYTTTETTFSYSDYGSVGTQNAKGGSYPFYAVMKASQGQSRKEVETDRIPVYIDTNAKITAVKKNVIGRLHTSWNAEWGNRPADADDWYYLVWEVNSSISATQPYNFSLNDTLNKDGWEVFGYRMAESGSAAYSANNTATDCTDTVQDNMLYARTDFVLTRHRKSTYDELFESTNLGKFVGYTLTNRADAEVTPIDRVDEKTQAYGTCVWPYERIRFESPAGYTGMDKYGYDFNLSGSNSPPLCGEKTCLRIKQRVE